MYEFEYEELVEIVNRCDFDKDILLSELEYYVQKECENAYGEGYAEGYDQGYDAYDG